MKYLCISAVRALVLVTLSACYKALVPAPEKVAAWTVNLRDAQPDDTFAAVYRYEDNYLVFVGAQHATKADSLTFQVIDDAYGYFTFDTVVVEGPKYSNGANAERLMSWIDSQHEINGFVEGGEIVPAVNGARVQGASVFGGEPDDVEVFSRVLTQGFSAEDLLGFHTLRSVPQWVREQKIVDAGDAGVEALITSALLRNRERLALSLAVLPGYDEWAQWYTQTNGKPFGRYFDPEEVGPLADGPYKSNRIATAISRARDEFLLHKIAYHLNAGQNVLIVFGESHLMILRPALDHMLGEPCHLGANLASARRQC